MLNVPFLSFFGAWLVLEDDTATCPVFVVPEVILYLPIITALECFVACFDSYSHKMQRKLFAKNKSPLRGRKDPCRMHPSLSDGERLACNKSLHSKHVPSVFWASHMIPTPVLGHGKTTSLIDRNMSCDAGWWLRICVWHLKVVVSTWGSLALHVAG